MRPTHALAVFATLALSFPAVAPASAATPLSSIFGCESSGNKQAGGAAIGGVLGGVVGNRVAGGDRTLGTLLGAAAGAAAGSYLGCRMQKSDQEKAELAARQALDRNQDGRWTNPETGASGDIRMVSAQGAPARRQPISLNGLRLARGVDLAAGYEDAPARYQTRGRTNLRGSPSTSAPVVGRLAAGERFDVLARARGTDWLLVGRNGVGAGYVLETVVQPMGRAAAASNCRTFDQTITARGGAPETRRYTACRNSAGEWAIQS